MRHQQANEVAGRFRRYPAYRESGVEWLGEIPEHWDKQRLKYVASCNNEVLSESTPPDYRLAYLDISSVSQVRGIEKVEEYDFDEAPSRARRRVKHGDTIISTVRTYLKAVASIDHPPENLIVSTGFAVIRPHQVIDGRFLAYLVQSEGFIGEVVANSVGVSYPAINASQITGFPVPLPGIPEQRAIAAFLDRETARIDALVAKKQRLIELLQEKRTALISHAVTRGLDPAAQLKDSGIEWLGQIPAHWEAYALKRELMFVTSGSRGWAGNYSDEGALFIRIGNLTRDSIRLDMGDIQRVTIPEGGAEGERTRVEPGDLIVSITAYLGSVAVVPEGVEEAYVSQHVALARPSGLKTLSQWLGYCLLSSVCKAQLEARGYGGTKVQLGLDDVRNLIIPVPNIEEQEQIISFVEEGLLRLERLQNRVDQIIGNLQEYRASLITHAVTGKIDVREVVAA